MTNSKPHQLSRRDFLKLSGTASLGLVLAACGLEPQPTGTPSLTNTPLPTNTLAPPETQTLPPTPTPTNTPEPSHTPTATPEPPTLRSVGEQLGVNFGTTVAETEKWKDKAYQEAVAKNFNLIYPTAAFQNQFFNRYSADEFISWALHNQQTLYIHGPIWNNDIPDELRNAPKEKIVSYMKKRASLIMDFVKRLHERGGKPPLVNFLNEAFWDDFVNNTSGWIDSPFYRVLGNNLMIEVYLLFFNAGKERGLESGIDYRLLYVDFNIFRKGAKARKTYKEVNRAKAELAKRLDNSIDQIQLDIGIQGNMFYDPSKRPFYMQAPPTEEELRQAIEFFNSLGGDTRIHLTEVNILGIKDQPAITQKYKEIFRTAVSTGCKTITFWAVLRDTPPPGEENDPYWAPQGLFDNGFAPTAEYHKIVEELQNLL